MQTAGNKLISSQQICARVREELRSYFYSGALDDLLFELWIKDCIDKFEYTYLPVHDCAMDMCNFRCELPCDFKAVREVWICTTFFKGPILSPRVYYYQTDCRINPAPFPAESCGECLVGDQCFPSSQTPTPVNVPLPDLCGVPEDYIVTHKVLTHLNFSYRVMGLLKPGNFKTVGRCHEQSPNILSSGTNAHSFGGNSNYQDMYCIDTFDIVGNEMITSFRDGTIYMSYYGSHAIQDESGYYMIPDNDPFQKYVYEYLRFMSFRQMADQATADDYRLAIEKMRDGEQRMGVAFQNAKSYACTDDMWGLEKRIVRSLNRNNRFIIR